MLDYRPRQTRGETVAFASPASVIETSEVWLHEALRILRRRFVLIAALACVTTALGTLYALTAQRIYTASTTLLIGANRVNIVAGDTANQNASSDVSVESQVQVLLSEAIAQRVIEKLKLIDDPEFNGSNPGLLSQLLRAPFDIAALVLPASWLPQRENADELSQARKDRIVLASLAKKLTVTRPVRTLVIKLSFSSQNAAKSAEIANAFAEAYLVDQLDVQFDQTKRAANWLNERLEELRDRVENAERSVEKYRSENSLLVVNGRLISDQQIQELDSQLTRVRSSLTDAKAKLEQIEAISAAGNDPSAISDVLVSPAVTHLKAQYADASRNVLDLSNRYGENHPLVRNAMQQQEALRSLIGAEVQRIAEAYKNQVAIETAREDGLKRSFLELEQRNAGVSQAQIRLRELERQAISARTVYERFLNRFKEISANEDLPSAVARVLAPASAPTSAEQPKVLLIIAISVLGGAGLGLGVAFSLEHLHVGLRTRRQVEQVLKVPCVALVPLVRAKGQKSLIHYAVEKPLSHYAEAIRSLKMALRFSADPNEAKVLVVASALPGEGKSTTALSLALYSASTGAKTLLVDADMRRPTATGLLHPSATFGLGDVLRGERRLSETLFKDPKSGLFFLPTLQRDSTTSTAELLASDKMAELVAECRSVYDCVILDVSPIIPIVDSRPVLNVADKVLLVVEWNKTSRSVINEAFQLTNLWKDNFLGVVLNKVDLRRIHHYEGYNLKKIASKYPAYYGEKS